MPHITISMYAGRDNATKQRFAKAVKQTMIDQLGFTADQVSVSVEDIDKENFIPTINKRFSDNHQLIQSSDLIK